MLIERVNIDATLWSRTDTTISSTNHTILTSFVSFVLSLANNVHIFFHFVCIWDDFGLVSMIFCRHQHFIVCRWTSFHHSIARRCGCFQFRDGISIIHTIILLFNSFSSLCFIFFSLPHCHFIVSWNEMRRKKINFSIFVYDSWLILILFLLSSPLSFRVVCHVVSSFFVYVQNEDQRRRNSNVCMHIKQIKLQRENIKSFSFCLNTK